MWHATGKKFPPGPSEGMRRWSLGPLNDTPLEYFTKLAREYGDVAGIRVLNFKTIFINHPDTIEEALVANARKYIKGRVLRANRHVFGEGLLTSDGEFWLRQRRLAQPAFHRGRIASYAATMVEYTERMLSGWQGGEERDAHQEMMRLTLQIVGKTLFDADVERDAKDVGKSLEQLLEMGANFQQLLEGLADILCITLHVGEGCRQIPRAVAGNGRKFPADHFCAALAADPHEPAHKEGSGSNRENSLPNHRGTTCLRPRRRGSALDAPRGAGRRRFAHDGPPASR